MANLLDRKLQESTKVYQCVKVAIIAIRPQIGVGEPAAEIQGIGSAFAAVQIAKLPARNGHDQPINQAILVRQQRPEERSTPWLSYPPELFVLA